MKPSGARALERDVEEKLTQLRLKLLEEKLKSEKNSSGHGSGASAAPSNRPGRESRRERRQPPDNGDTDDDDDDEGLDAEIQLARARRAELRDLLERERKLGDSLANERLRRRPPSEADTERERRQSPRRSDRFAEAMQMMMMQNSQMHSLMLNQMMARQAQPPPPPPPPPLPQIPMQFLGYEGYAKQFGLMQQQQPGASSSERVDREPKPKPATPTTVKPAAAAAEETKREVAAALPQDDDDEEDQKTFPFPGNRSQQKLRRLAYTAFFIASLNRLTNENKFRPRFDFLFDVRLKEMLETLHRIYKTPDGRLYSVTFATVMGEEAMELTELMNIPKTLGRDEERMVTQEIAYCIENTIFQITDIMPSKGILGTHRKSGLFELIRSGNRFPKGYFYDMESSMMVFDEDGCTQTVSDCDSRMLIIGLFLVRALIETLYLKTEHYGMVVETTAKAARNIKLVATLLMYIYRKVIGQLVVMDQGTKKARISYPDLPSVLAKVMYTDQEIRPVVKLTKKSLDYAINLLMHWSEEYVKRLRDAGFT